MAFVTVDSVVYCIHVPYGSLLIDRLAVACVTLSIIEHVDLTFEALLDGYVRDVTCTNRRDTGN